MAYPMYYGFGEPYGPYGPFGILSFIPPTAHDDYAYTSKNKAVRIDVIDNDCDPDGNKISVLSFTDPAHGSVSLNSDGTLTYTPDSGFNRDTDSFTYTIQTIDGTDTATVYIAVDPEFASNNDTKIGDDSDNTLNGGYGDDFLDGRDGDDKLNGGEDDDLLLGGNGRDTLNGGDGCDTLMGGEGADTLRGGYGHDVFRFETGDSGVSALDPEEFNVDLIKDFQQGCDLIDLSGYDAIVSDFCEIEIIEGPLMEPPLIEGFLIEEGPIMMYPVIEDPVNEWAWIGSCDFSNTAGELRYQFIGNKTAVMGDTDGDGAADLMILLNGNIELGACDFIGAYNAWEYYDV